MEKAYFESFERRVIAHENNEAQRRTDELKGHGDKKHALEKFHYPPAGAEVHRVAQNAATLEIYPLSDR